jgi:hypothetical protein
METEDLPGTDSLDLRTEWAGYRRNHYHNRKEAFLSRLREMVSDPDTIDEVTFCEHCGNPEWEDNTRSVRSMTVCESCLEDWTCCDSCQDEYPDTSYLTMTLGESYVCNSCRSHNYSYCDSCEGYYLDEDSDLHDHRNSGCCESGKPEFSIRNDGNEPLANDTRATVTLPAGIISAEGMREIRNYLQRQGYYDLSYYFEGSVGDHWQTKEGNFTKRLSRHAYKHHHLSLSPEVISHIGNIAGNHSRAVDVEIDVTRKLNESPGYFYHDDSCWWGGYSESRCALKTNGGFGIRSLNGNSVTGRAWVMPLKMKGSLVATFDTMTPDAFVVFNGYGDLSGYAPARIMAHLAGWTYRKIDFSCDPMYVNAGGYIVAPEDIAGKYTDGSLRLSVRQHSNLLEEELVSA